MVKFINSNRSVSVHEYFKHIPQNQYIRFIVDVDNMEPNKINDVVKYLNDILNKINPSIYTYINFRNDSNKYARIITNIAAPWSVCLKILELIQINGFDSCIYKSNSLRCPSSYKIKDNKLIKNYYNYNSQLNYEEHFIQNISNCIKIEHNLLANSTQ